MHRLAPHAAWFARNFYQALFALDPALRPVFRTDMEAQGLRLVRMLSSAVDGLVCLDTLVPVLRALGRRHAAYGARHYDFETMGLALMCALTRLRDETLDDPTLAAWRAAYQWMAREIHQGLVEGGMKPTRRYSVADSTR